jgi:hypothetical protein
LEELFFHFFLGASNLLLLNIPEVIQNQISQVLFLIFFDNLLNSVLLLLVVNIKYQFDSTVVISIFLLGLYGLGFIFIHMLEATF